jgi:uncharacterized protein YbcI
MGDQLSEKRMKSRGEILTEISNAMVQLHREHFGRGSGAAKTVLVDDLLLCVLTDVFTPVERTLIRSGDHERVRETRLLHQLALEDRYKGAVRDVTGREVVAFVSGIHFDPDMATELFVLEPEPR